jgi:hypothetical protein
MYISLNKKDMRVMHKHPSINVVSNLVYLEVPKGLCNISTLDMCLYKLTDLELKLLYKNTVGEDKYPPDLAKSLLGYIAAYVPVTDVIPEELARFAATVGPNDKKTYKYIKGQFTSFVSPTVLDHPVTIPRHHPDPPPAFFPKKPSVLDDLNDNDPIPNAEEIAAFESKGQNLIKSQRTPRDPLAGPSSRPKEGSTTGKVWDIADELYTTIKDDKQLRKAVIERCTKEGINSSTTSVQFGKWKTAR